METATLQGSYQAGSQKRLTAEASPALPSARKKPVRRRGSLQQGFALETLGHAVEYLVDSRLFAQTEREVDSDQQAIQLLMRMSRAVFAECPEVLPLYLRMGRRIAAGWLPRRSGEVPIAVPKER